MKVTTALTESLVDAKDDAVREAVKADGRVKLAEALLQIERSRRREIYWFLGFMLAVNGIVVAVLR